MQDDQPQLRPEESATGHPPSPGNSLGYLLYRSVARPGLTQDELDRILQIARDRNRAMGLTGCLHYEDGLFFQWLEGPRFRLYHLCDALRDDPRHVNFTILDPGPLQQRLFQDWDMRFSDREVASMMDWLAARPDTAGELDYADGVGAFIRQLKG